MRTARAGPRATGKVSHTMNADRHTDRARAELRWYFHESESAMGFAAMSLEPQTRGSGVPSTGPSGRVLSAADRARRVREVLHRLPTHAQSALAAAHAPLPPAIANEPALRQDRDAAEQTALALALFGSEIIIAKPRQAQSLRARAKRELHAVVALFVEGWLQTASWRPIHIGREA